MVKETDNLRMLEIIINYVNICRIILLTITLFIFSAQQYYTCTANY